VIFGSGFHVDGGIGRTGRRRWVLVTDGKMDEPPRSGGRRITG
jgi:hypothetical protein